MALGIRYLAVALPPGLAWWRDFACECLTAQCQAASERSAVVRELVDTKKNLPAPGLDSGAHWLPLSHTGSSILWGSGGTK